jgi:hypothetical protein
MDSIKDLIKNNVATFNFYRHGVAYYDIKHDNKTYTFPVPLSDIGEATLLATDKAIFFMRYLRKASDENTLVIA